MSNKALIIGGGPCGASTALALQKKGIECQVFEREGSETAKNIGAAITLHGGAVCLKYLGFGDEWMRRKDPLINLQMITNTDKFITTIQNTAVTGIPNAEWIGMIPRQELYDMFIKFCNDTDGITYRFNKKFKHYEQNKDEITAYFEDGTKATGNILIGCDGINSNVRKCMLGDTENEKCRKYTGYSYYYTVGSLDDIDINMNKFKDDFLFQLNDEYPTMATYQKLARSNMYICTLFYKQENAANIEWGIYDSKEGLMEKYKEYKYNDNFQYLVENSERISNVGLYTIQLKGIRDSWHDNRAIIIGDAAHATTPFGGQGANQSIYDGIYMAHLFGEHKNEKLKDYKSEEINEIFKKVYEYRAPIMNSVVDLSLKTGYLYIGLPPALYWLRNIFFKTVIGSISLTGKGMKAILNPKIGFDIDSVEKEKLEKIN